MTADQLRKSILQWAIRGKLTKQNSDESAADLLNEIRSEKQKLIEENKVKKMDLINSFIYKNPGDNCYYEKFEEINNKSKDNQKISIKLMSLWQVVYFDKRFKGVEKHKQSKVLKYKHISSEELNSIKKDNNGKVRLLSTGKLDGFCNIELDDNRVNFGKVITIPTGGSAIIKYHSGYFIDSLNILMESQDNNLYDSKYIYYCLLEQSDLIQQYFKGSSIQHPDMKKIVEISLLIPNIEIQRNIVRTIEVLEPLIAIYSELFSELELLRNELPKKLENSIINYAMEGKLVKQDQNNDSVDNLINEIYKEKQKLVEQGKLKKADLNNLIIYKNDNDNSYYEKFENGREEKIEVPFEIPYNWIWSRFNKVVNFKIGKTPPTNDLSFWNGKIPWVSISDMIKNSKIKSTKKFISKKALSSYFNNNLVKKETLIMSFKLTVGKTSILGIDAVHNEGIISIYPYFDKNNLFRDFLMLFLPIFSQFGDKKEAIKGGTLNTKSLSKLLIPIPPLKEQQRIVENITKIQKLLKNL